jgi:ferredoxin-NADP reductase
MNHSDPRLFPSRVLATHDECANVRTFTLEVPTDFAFIPGMWVMVNFADDPKLARAYSMSSSPLIKGSIEISLNKVGDFSARMYALMPGDSVELKGPYGKWHYDDEIEHAVLISGGTGLTPFRAMGRYVLEKKLPNKITILYSVKTPDDILYTKDLDAFRAAGFKIYVTATRAAAGSWKGPSGRLDIDTIRAQVPDWESAHYYFCGPKSLIDELSGALEANGVDRENIHREKWGDY